MRATAAGLLLTALLAGTSPAFAAPVDHLSAARADRVALEDVYSQSGAARTVPGPSWMDYIAEVFARAAGWLSRRVEPLGQLLGPWSRVVAFVLAGVLLLALVILLVRLVTARARTTAAQSAGEAVATRPDPPPSRDREDWRGELETLLARDEILPALRALWWWFALSASPGGVDPAWTSREVLARAGRGELLPVARVLDRMIYGSAPPGAPEVRALLARMEAALA